MARQLREPWLDKYLEYVQESEAPEVFRYWAGVSALSTTLKRNVFIRRGFIKMYPNHYIVLVSPPGIGKGTAMNPAIELVKEAGVAHYMEDRVTAEKATELLADGFPTTMYINGAPVMGKDHCATAVAAELSIFLGASDWMLPYLCSMWDKNEFTNSTKKNGSTVIKDLCFGLLGGCTPSYIRDVNKDAMAAVASGFTSRTIFAWATKKGAIVPWPDVPSDVLKQPLVDDLKYIATNVKGEMVLTPEAKAAFIDFYKQNEVIAQTAEIESDVLINFRARMWAHVMKLAIVLSVSERDDLLITEQNILTAIEKVTEVFKTLDVTFRGVGESDLADAMDRVMSFIEQRGLCTRAEIYRKLYRHITDEDLTRVLFTLQSIGFCQEHTQGKQTRYVYNQKFNATQTYAKVKSANAGN